MNVNLSNRFEKAEALVELLSKQDQPIQVLDLNNNNIGPVGIKLILDFLLVHTNTSETLTHLDLSHTQLRDDGCKILVSQLNRFPNLRVLKLGFNKITGEVCDVFQGMIGENLRELNLKYNQLGPDGVNKLSADNNLIHLETLDLTENGIGDRGLTVLCNQLLSVQGNCLKHLSVWGNKIGDQTLISSFCKSVLSKPQCRLVSIDLTSNNLTQVGIEHLSCYIERSQATCGQLVDVCVSGNFLVKDQSSLKKVLARNKEAQTRIIISQESVRNTIPSSNLVGPDPAACYLSELQQLALKDPTWFLSYVHNKEQEIARREENIAKREKSLGEMLNKLNGVHFVQTADNKETVKLHIVVKDLLQEE
mgnify:FL=1